MKNLLIIILLIGASSCVQEYKDIKSTDIKGVELKIDSAQWTPALIQWKGSELVIFEAKERKVVDLYNGKISFLFGLIVGGTVSLGVLIIGGITDSPKRSTLD